MSTSRSDALEALTRNGGNVKRTAIELGIPRTTLISIRDRAELKRLRAENRRLTDALLQRKAN